MSTYYDYYLGVKKEDGKVYPIGPYTKDGHLVSIFSTTGHWGSLQDDCWDMPDSIASDELFDRFKVSRLFEEGDRLFLRYTDLKDVYARAKDGGLMFGYVPTKLITRHEKHKTAPYDYESAVDELNCEVISPIEYAALSEKNREKYAYYAWLDTESASYEASRIAEIATELLPQLIGYGKDDNVVVLVNIR